MSPTETQSLNSLEDVFFFSRPQDIFRSWFWRFYDHLFQLILYNIGWFLTCIIAGWFAWKLSLPLEKHLTKYLIYYFIFVIEGIVSLGWAHLIFKIFNGELPALIDIWYGYRTYIKKTMGLLAISGFVIMLGMFSIQFYLVIGSHNKFASLMVAGFVFWILIFWISTFLYQWPILFFQNPPLLKIIHKSILIVMANSLITVGFMIFFLFFFIFFTFLPFLWLILGLVFFFSFMCVALEKHFLRYKIIYGNKPLDLFLEYLTVERKRGWRDFLRPWENG